MIDTLLTNVLHIVIALDIFGAIALFILSAKRRQTRSENALDIPTHSSSNKPFWKSSPPFLSCAFPAYRPQDMKRLHTVLRSFEEGLLSPTIWIIPALQKSPTLTFLRPCW